MLKKMNSKRRLTIALLLIGSCVLATTLISNAFGINLKFVYGFTKGGEVEDTDQIRMCGK